ncbi:MAG TPA: hypothetical protein VJQ79_03860, partial [Acidimicrobiia bacterium]|nr:hypothetical protein [Acidimicrobiia bacterium]
VIKLVDVALLSVTAGTPTQGSPFGTAAIAIFFFIIMTFVGYTMVTDQDRTWLPVFVIAGFVAKLLGSTARYLVLELVYGGKGDASGYHGSGLELSSVWRSFQVPSSIQRVGTDVLEGITGLLYVPYQPSKLGGFFIFASISFFGQLLLYAAFRHSFPARHLKWYAALIFFWPTMVYWPSSIGKEAMMVLWIGIASYGVARLLKSYNPGWILLIGVGLAGGGIIRLHMSLLLAGGLVLALLFAKAPAVKGAQIRRLGLLGVAAVGLVIAAVFTAADFGVDLAAVASAEAATDEVGNVLSGVEAQTDKGGSAVTGSAVSSPLDLPEAILRVMFRPLPNEATNIQTLASSLEGTILLLVFIVRLPWILRNMLRMRRTPYSVFAFVYTGGFIIAFSAILNLGILARQRSQVIPFFLALLVVWGRKHVDEDDEVSTVAIEVEPRQLELGGVSAPQPALTLVRSGSGPAGSWSQPRR